MTSSNVARVREYLHAVAAMVDFEQVADFYSTDVVIQEFPNGIAPHGRLRRMPELRKAFDEGRKIIQSQTYQVRRIIENGEELAIELEWAGVLAVPVMNLDAGNEMKAFVAMFLSFRDGKIVSQRNYDCYPPFETEDGDSNTSQQK